ncbi:hypothetical protein N0V90_012154 [Kalmusia sp. IMI 367209]|nr:hypothetical protein N0V90_012154 [Kalmusia sp. IMI 367209]
MSSTTNPEWNNKTAATTVAATFPEAIKNRTILITGVNKSGLGYGTASAFATQSPSTIIITGRAPTKLQESLESLRAAYPAVNFKPLTLDLSSQKSVRQAAAEVLEWNDIPAIDIVVNNAGVMNIQERTFSVDGIEMHFATNHIGHFLFTNLIMSKILAGKTKRIINISSLGTFVSPIRASDLKWETPLGQIPEKEKPNVAMLKMARLFVDDETTYIPMGAYGMSKTANILYSVGLNTRLGDKGVLSLALHPGEIMTELQRSTDLEWLEKTVEFRVKSGQPGFKTVDEGAATGLVAATDPKLGRPGADGKGTYLSDCQITEQVPPYSLDKAEADKLWEISEGIVGEKFAW